MLIETPRPNVARRLARCVLQDSQRDVGPCYTNWWRVVCEASPRFRPCDKMWPSRVRRVRHTSRTGGVSVPQIPTVECQREPTVSTGPRPHRIQALRTTSGPVTSKVIAQIN